MSFSDTNRIREYQQYELAETIEGKIAALIVYHDLPEDAEFYLDSIAWQLEQARKTPQEINQQIRYACSIASKTDDPEVAMQLLDLAIQTELKYDHRQTQSMLETLCKNNILHSKIPQTLYKQVCEYFKELNAREKIDGLYPERRSMINLRNSRRGNEANSWQENSIKAMEG